ncbi:uncharacterized protein SPPG_03917 [Spizellomyces punctatus DAOM BR117]|uniref:Uncharacterized protein n=1 Tax=Spizellomyces punctatus (strain DAOM BR117) TaxID=645134 RepID=A0A0L0HJ00_SPIPD|nr:uncharacterized protein SPPG_03917 [Spizellomyces punctatus DAOM BR117]KND00809.1 hypothetical protein SPPG_03917 [Spizellomyces punctatus DAOM BR117]|eukprot:XP_016608848.1 hypothetical protein SPPG_03917 [Spizellomyces punctatus DAOM BR117]
MSGRAYPFPYSLVVGSRQPPEATLRLSAVDPLTEPIEPIIAETCKPLLETDLTSFKNSQSYLEPTQEVEGQHDDSERRPVVLHEGRSSSPGSELAANQGHDLGQLSEEAMNDTERTPQKEEFPFRLPNLLEAHLRRQALQEAQKQNPSLPHTRILYANFSRVQYRKPNKPPSPKQDTPNDVQSEPIKIVREAKRRRVKRVAKLAPMRFTGGAPKKEAVTVQPKSAYRSAESEGTTGKVPARPSSVQLAHPKSTHQAAGSSTVAEPQSVAERRLSASPHAFRGFVASNPTVSRRPSINPTEITMITQGRRTSNVFGVDSQFGTGNQKQERSRRTSLFSSPSSARRRMSVDSFSGAFRPRSTRRRRGGPSNTPAREEQLLECDHILSAFEEKYLFIRREVVERAILRPEEIIRLPPTMPAYGDASEIVASSVATRSQAANVEDNRDDDIIQRPPRRRSLLVKPAVVLRESLSDIDMSRSNSPKVNSWWSRAELKLLRARLRAFKDGHYQKPAFVKQEDGSDGAPFSLSFANSRYSLDRTGVTFTPPRAPSSLRARSAFTRRLQANVGRPSQEPMTQNTYAARRRTISVFDAYVLPIASPQRPRSVTGSILTDGRNTPTAERRSPISELRSKGQPLWGITVKLH